MVKKKSYFWDKNPCGGEWNNFKKKRDWLIKTEPHILEMIREDLLNNKNVLDVGCGQGFIISLVSEKCKKVTGVDLSYNSLNRIKRWLKENKKSNIGLIKANAENLPFEDSSFDTVYCHGVLHHTMNTQKGIDEINRVLKKDGKTVVMLYRKYCPKGIFVTMIRLISKIIDKIKKEDSYLFNHFIKEKYQEEKFSSKGTAFPELFGCPILKTFSLRKTKKMFNNFSKFDIKCVEPGFLRLSDFSPFLNKKIIKKFLNKLDKKTENIFGFYIIIEAKK